MRTMGLQRPEPSFTEFACVSREFGPLEPASGPFRCRPRAPACRPKRRGWSSPGFVDTEPGELHCTKSRG
jgi:hypothetical protein